MVHRREEEEESKHELDGQDEEWMDDVEAQPSTLPRACPNLATGRHCNQSGLESSVN